MTTQTQELPNPKVGTSQENSAVEPPQKDPLIAQGEERVVYFGVFLLTVGIVTVIALLSRRLDYAIIFGLLLSVVLITIFLIV